MKKYKLSIIIPTCQEYPQNVFTIRNLAEECTGLDFEIIVIDNWCDEVAKQANGRERDITFDQLKAVESGHSWLKVLHYDKKLSHWQAKNLGVRNSTGDVLFFCDAHCIVSKDALVEMFESYTAASPLYETNFTYHLPLTYHIVEHHKLVYNTKCDVANGVYHYTFCGFRDSEKGVQEIDAMSTCGMMMSKDLYDKLGGWPEELGIYGGGENFINYTMAVMGYKKYIFGSKPLFHHGAKRGYHWNHYDYHRNRAIAHYMFGGQYLLKRYIEHSFKNSSSRKAAIANEIISKCWRHRDLIKEKQIMSIEEWYNTGRVNNA